MKRDGEIGVVLVNVLVIIALSAAVVHLMLGSRETAINRVRLMAEATDAEMLALGAEASVMAALRRDIEEAPEADHFGEAWATIAQAETRLVTGRFAVEIQDVQRKYDINRLTAGGIGPTEMLGRLLAEVEQPPELAPRIATVLQRVGPVRDLDDLAAFGIPGTTLDALRPYMAALPVAGEVNLNTADPVLLRAMLNNGSIAARLVAQRNRDLQITRETLSAAGAVRPDHTGFTSNLFDVIVRAEAGDAAIRLKSRILRINEIGGQSVGILSRRFLPVDEPSALN